MTHSVINVITGQKSNRPALPPGAELSVKGVPAEVTMRQARLALLSAGLLEQVEAAINALPEQARASARIEWEFSNTVQRNNAFLMQLGQALSLTRQQIDELFIAAVQF